MRVMPRFQNQTAEIIHLLSLNVAVTFRFDRLSPDILKLRNPIINSDFMIRHTRVLKMVILLK